MKTSLACHLSNGHFYFFAGTQIHALHEADFAILFIPQHFNVIVYNAEVIKL